MATSKTKARPKSRTSHIPHVVKTRGAVKEANARFAAADAVRKQSPNLLLPADISGKYDASRVLSTTLGGEIRPLTQEDLEAFRDNIATVSRHYTKGLTAQKIINLSRDDDRLRANEQIHYAVPSSANRGNVRFITNAGPESEYKRHFVWINILDYQAQSATPDEPRTIARRMAKNSPLQIWCDCPRFRFWYAYVATIGGLNAGPRAENAFPKIRNPMLTGIACKHILRSLHDFQRSSAIQNVLARMVQRAQSDAAVQQELISGDEARRIAQQQSRKQRDVEVKLPGPKPEWSPLRARIKKKWTADKEKQPAKTADRARADALKNLRKLKDLGQLSQADYNKILATLQK
ncbi:hypothetical protein R70199_03713 [Paraburkholderia domus]|nr:hypothetical protein R70199_03713 [Paraburkholderia domus]